MKCLKWNACIESRTCAAGIDWCVTVHQGHNKLQWIINSFTLQDKINFGLILTYTNLPVAFLIVGNPPDCIAVHKCLRIFSHKFAEFESTLRDTLHNNMHCRIGGKGGTMCSKQSANAPEFILHHAFTDKLWADWQKKETRYKNAYFRGNIYLYGISPRMRPQNLLDLSKQPGDQRWASCLLHKGCHPSLSSAFPLLKVFQVASFLLFSPQ